MDNNYTQNNYQKPKNTNNLIALICSIVGLVIAILGGILYGIIGAIIGLAGGVVGVVFAIKAKNETNGAVGQAAFVVGIIAVAFGFVFFVGCGACGCMEQSSYTGSSYTCYGLCGGSCMAANDAKNVINSYNSLFY